MHLLVNPIAISLVVVAILSEFHLALAKDAKKSTTKDDDDDWTSQEYKVEFGSFLVSDVKVEYDKLNKAFRLFKTVADWTLNNKLKANLNPLLKLKWTQKEELVNCDKLSTNKLTSIAELDCKPIEEHVVDENDPSAKDYLKKKGKYNKKLTFQPQVSIPHLPFVDTKTVSIRSYPLTEASVKEYINDYFKVNKYYDELRISCINCHSNTGYYVEFELPMDIQCTGHFYLSFRYPIIFSRSGPPGVVKWNDIKGTLGSNEYVIFLENFKCINKDLEGLGFSLKTDMALFKYNKMPYVTARINSHVDPLKSLFNFNFGVDQILYDKKPLTIFHAKSESIFPLLNFDFGHKMFDTPLTSDLEGHLKNLQPPAYAVWLDQILRSDLLFSNVATRFRLKPGTGDDDSLVDLQLLDHTAANDTYAMVGSWKREFLQGLFSGFISSLFDPAPSRGEVPIDLSGLLEPFIHDEL